MSQSGTGPVRFGVSVKCGYMYDVPFPVISASLNYIEDIEYNPYFRPKSAECWHLNIYMYIYTLLK